MKEYCQCRLCKSENIEVVLDLGATPPANAFLTRVECLKDREKYPLQLFLCKDCNSVQLKHTVEPEILFKNYFYESSTSASFRKHFEDYARDTVFFLGLAPKSFIVDIGSNDNVLLKPFKALDMTVCGVEPAKNIVDKLDGSISVINDFFNRTTAAYIEDGYGKADVITCNNCFAHIDDIHEVIAGVKQLLKPNGTFIFENAYLLDTVNNGDLGQVYHEHLFYHSIKPLRKFLMKYDLELFHVERNNIQCGSIRCYVRHAYGQFLNWSSVEELMKAEEDAGLYNPETYKNLKTKIDENGVKLTELLKQIKADNKKIAGYAWPAKATTLTSYYDIGYFMSFVVEDAKAKQGMWTPVFSMPIFDKGKLADCDYAMILAYNFNDAIIKSNPDFKGKWIKILPTLEVV